MNTTQDINNIRSPFIVGNDSSIVQLTLQENKNSTIFRDLKAKIFHSSGKDITIQLKEPPEREEYNEVIDNGNNLIDRLGNWLYRDKRLCLVCISNQEDLTYSFI